MSKVKLLVVDDHPMLRGGIISLFEKVDNIDVIGEAKNGSEALKSIENEKPDAILMDINLDGELDVNTTELIKQKWPEIKVLVFSMHQELQVIKRMLNAGASGYVIKNASHKELVKAINAVMLNEIYYSQEVEDIIARGALANGDKEEVVLSNREKEVLRYVAKEFTNQEIADSIHISLRTVETHKRNLIKKLGVKNVVGLVRFALEQGPMMNL
ncbi:response regulator [Bacteroidota bacterium]